MGFGFGEFNIMFSTVFFIVTVGFVIILVSIIVIMIKNVMMWNKNNHSPQLTVAARVVSKRINIHHYSHTNTGNVTRTHNSHTTYYVTFEFDSGDRMEFLVKDSEYGMLVEGDIGNLSFQGTRYLNFERSK